MSIVEFPHPKVPTTESLLVGPFEEWRVQVEGRIIPRLTGYRQDDGRITLIVDRRFMVDFPEDVASQAAWLLAHALAVGEGYTHLGATDKNGQPFAPLGMEVSGEPVEI